MATLGGEAKLVNGTNEDCLTKATEAAARVNALLIAKGKLKPSQLSSDARQKGNGKAAAKFDAEVEINDAPIICRDILTKNVSQDEISKKTGAFITTKGRYISPEQRHLITDINQDRPLYLYIQAETEVNVQRAVSEINNIIHKHGGVVNQTRGSTISIEAPASFHPLQERDESAAAYMPVSSSLSLPSQVQFLSEKLYIGLEHAPPSFDVRGKVLGSEGSFLQHIHAVSGAVVTLRGRNSGYLEPETTQESTEPMHIHLQHMTVEGLEKAKELANDLIKTVQNDYSQFQRQLAALHANPMVSSVVSHTLPGTLVTMQSVVPGVLNYPSQDQQVLLSSSPNLSQPVSMVISQQLPYTQTKPPMYVQSAHQPVPVVTSNLVTPVGYNSLTSQGVEVVHQPLPLSRPLPSVTSEVAASGSQPLMTILSHPSSIEGAPSGPPPPPPSMLSSEAAVIHAPGAIRQPLEIPQHQANVTPVSIQPLSLHIAAPADAGHVPVSVVPLHSSIASTQSPVIPSPIITSTTGHEPQVILVSTVLSNSTNSLSYGGCNRGIYPALSTPSALPSSVSSVIAKSRGDALTYIVQQPVEPQIVHIEQQIPEQNMTHPPHAHPPPGPPGHIAHPPPGPPGHIAHPPPGPPGHVSAPPGHMPPTVNDTPSQVYPISEYQHTIVPASVEVVHVQAPEVIAHQPSNAISHPMDTHINDQRQSHNTSASGVIRPGTVQTISVPDSASDVRYAPQSHPLQSTAAVAAVSSSQVVIPSLMEIQLSSSRAPPPPPPPIEPPPHLADNYQPTGNRPYNRDKPYPHSKSEIRPPYRGSGRPYSAITPPPPPPPPRRSVYNNGLKYKKQFGPRYSSSQHPP